LSHSNLSELVRSELFHALVILAVGIYALNAILIAVEAGYDLWGRFALGCLQGLGGGTIRDFLIGGRALPPGYTRDPSFILTIFSVTLIVSFLSATKTDFHRSASFQRVKKYADIFGFAMLATVGACIGVSSGIGWYWVPVFAALTSAGGGALRDIAVMKAPATFTGVIFEEVAVFGGIILLVALQIDMRWFNTQTSLTISVFFTAISVVLLRLWTMTKHIQYPEWLLYKTNRQREADITVDPAFGEILPQMKSFVIHCGISWSVPRELLTNASSSLEECLILLQASGRGNPHHISASYDERKLQLSLVHGGLPLEIDSSQASHSDGKSSEQESFPSAENLAFQLLNYYVYSVESRTRGEHADLVMTFQSEGQGSHRSFKT